MVFVRMYTGDDGESHFEDMDPNMVPGEVTAEGSFSPDVQEVSFIRQPAGYNRDDWHTASRRMYVITLAGELELKVKSGDTRRVGPGDVFLAEDLTGGGHAARVVGGVPRLLVTLTLGG